MAIMFLVGYAILNRMTIGRRIYAIGGNLRAAQLSGINVDRVLLFVYAFAGFCAAVSGIIVASRLSSGQPAGSIGFELDVIAAVVVGGTSLAGGRGRLLNTLLGAILIAVLGNGLILMDVPEYWQRIVTGCVIVIAVTADMLLRRRTT
jgi:ribose transport system permease protein